MGLDWIWTFFGALDLDLDLSFFGGAGFGFETPGFEFDNFWKGGFGFEIFLTIGFGFGFKHLTGFGFEHRWICPPLSNDEKLSVMLKIRNWRDNVDDRVSTTPVIHNSSTQNSLYLLGGPIYNES